ncbi:hypothetical protein SO802_032303 [Lithocarpus litseifolius]|uniref:Uncharacterized protein n=1 Tax=Lithocarpus litseifolius TaxID=425828 RepID=A0AAW2BQ74_9ROSI
MYNCYSNRAYMHGYCSACIAFGEATLRPIGFRRNGDAVFVFGEGKLVSWNPESKEFKDFRMISDHNPFIDSYTESLVLLDKAANVAKENREGDTAYTLQRGSNSFGQFLLVFELKVGGYKRSIIIPGGARREQSINVESDLGSGLIVEVDVKGRRRVSWDRNKRGVKNFKWVPWACEVLGQGKLGLGLGSNKLAAQLPSSKPSLGPNTTSPETLELGEGSFKFVEQRSEILQRLTQECCASPIGELGCTESSQMMVFNFSSDQNSILGSNMLSGGVDL